MLAAPPNPKQEDSPCRLSTIAYSIYSQLPSILEAVQNLLTGPMIFIETGSGDFISNATVLADVRFKRTFAEVVRIQITDICWKTLSTFHGPFEWTQNGKY